MTRIAPTSRPGIKSRLPFRALKGLPIPLTAFFEKLTGPLLVMAHTQVQFDMFLKWHGIPRDRARRILGERDVRCLRPVNPLILLPGYMETRECDEILAIWHHYDGKVLRISEDCARAKIPLCENDTNGDGDCAMCAKTGGCKWPNHSK